MYERLYEYFRNKNYLVCNFTKGNFNSLKLHRIFKIFELLLKSFNLKYNSFMNGFITRPIKNILNRWQCYLDHIDDNNINSSEINMLTKVKL